MKRDEIIELLKGFEGVVASTRDRKAIPADVAKAMISRSRDARKSLKKDMALAACKSLVIAYQTGEHTGSSIDWSDLDIAYETALMALGKEKK